MAEEKRLGVDVAHVVYRELQGFAMVAFGRRVFTLYSMPGPLGKGWEQTGGNYCNNEGVLYSTSFKRCISSFK